MTQIRDRQHHELIEVSLRSPVAIDKQVRPCDTCVIDQPVDLPVCCNAGFGDVSACVGLTEISTNDLGANRILLAQCVSQLTQAIFPARHQDQVFARGGQLLGELRSQPGGGPSDERVTPVCGICNRRHNVMDQLCSRIFQAPVSSFATTSM